MKQIGLLLPLLLLLSCGSAPEMQESAPLPEPAQAAEYRPVQPVNAAPPAEPVPPEPGIEENYFNPESISEDLYVSTLVQVQTLIGELNRIIRSRNYESWINHLSAAYFEEINSMVFLEEQTEQLYRLDVAMASARGVRPAQVRRRELETARDYFINIVVPSRQNDRVDDIDFVSENHVIAYTVDPRGNRLILYNLEMIDGEWRIVN